MGNSKLTLMIIFLFTFSCNTGGDKTKTTEYGSISGAGTDYSAPAPEVHTVSTEFERIVVVRLKNKKDVLEGLTEAVIKNGVILSIAGSLTKFHTHVVDNKTFPSKNVFTKKDIPVDLISADEYIFDGRVHCHITLSDKETAYGGHLEPGCEVFTFLIVIIGVFREGVNLRNFDNSRWN